MPWQYTNDAKHYLLGSVFSFVIGTSIFWLIDTKKFTFKCFKNH
jgi:hypothetical protein